MEFLEIMEPWMIPIVVMICVTLIVAIATAGDLIKTKMKQNTGNDLSTNREFLAALKEFKENMERRVSNLEAIAAGDELSGSKSKTKNSDRREFTKTADIELDTEPETGESDQQTKLKNMLNQ